MSFVICEIENPMILIGGRWADRPKKVYATKGTAKSVATRKGYDMSKWQIIPLSEWQVFADEPVTRTNMMSGKPFQTTRGKAGTFLCPSCESYWSM